MIHNEQTKLLASALDRASTALGIGSVFPLMSLVKPDQGKPDSATAVVFAASFLVFAAWAVVLHPSARRVLRGLR